MSFLAAHIYFVNSDSDQSKSDADITLDKQAYRKEITHELDGDKQSAETPDIQQSVDKDNNDFKLKIVKAVEKEEIIWKYKSSKDNFTLRKQVFTNIAEKLLSSEFLSSPDSCK